MQTLLSSTRIVLGKHDGREPEAWSPVSRGLNCHDSGLCNIQEIDGLMYIFWMYETERSTIVSAMYTITWTDCDEKQVGCSVQYNFTPPCWWQSQHRPPYWLRHYPTRFGKKLVQLFADLVADKAGMPELPPKVPKAAETFNSLIFGDLWPEAHMQDVAHYLRGGVHLKIPRAFVDLLPRKLWAWFTFFFGNIYWLEGSESDKPDLCWSSEVFDWCMLAICTFLPIIGRNP